MDVRLYLGENTYTPYNVSAQLWISYVPYFIDDEIRWDYYPNWPDTGVTTTLVAILDPVPSIYTNDKMAENLKTYIASAHSATTIATHSSGDEFVTITMLNGSPINNVDYEYDVDGYPVYITATSTSTSYALVDLMKEETIEVINKLSDVEKLGSVFSDFSETFSVPTTANNNALFKHYYNIDRDNTFNANIRVPGYLEVNGIPYRFGSIQLDGISIKDNRPDTYKVGFFGGLVQLSDVFGDDTLDQLDYIEGSTGALSQVYDSLSRYDFGYSNTNINDSLRNPTFMSGDVITPLISYTDRDWNYGFGNAALDISTTTGAILDTELRPAIRVMRLIEAIETKYGVTFSRHFLGKAFFNNLFLWLNGKKEATINNLFQLNPSNTFTGTNVKIIYGNDSFTNNTARNTLDIYGVKYTESGIYTKSFRTRVFPSVSTTKYDLVITDESDNILKEYKGLFGNQDKTFDYTATTVHTTIFATTPRKIKIRPYGTISGTYDIICNSNQVSPTPSVYAAMSSMTNSFSFESVMKVNENTPKLTVVDFIQGIMKQFKLVIRPESATSFYMNSLDGYYGEGNILDVTKYVDNAEMEIERPTIFKTIKFNYQKSDNVLGKRFRETNDPINKEIGYGDEKVEYPLLFTKDELKVELPFENMLFERMEITGATKNTLTNVIIGQSIKYDENTANAVTTATISKNESKPILFFNNGLVRDTAYPLKFKFQQESPITLSHQYIIGNTDDEFIDQVTQTLNFDAEIDPWHQTTVENGLYLNYWDNWITTIYDLHQRKITIPKTILPMRYVNELSLNDRLLIGNNRYKINDYTINLNNGETKFTLFKDIYSWSAYEMPRTYDFTPFTLTPTGWLTRDELERTDTYYLYGDFSGYNGTQSGNLVKFFKNGSRDTSFNVGTGFNSNSSFTNSFIEQPDGKLIVTGGFTQFSGQARNRIVRLNTGGTLDTSFVIGTGFDNRTSELGLQTSGKIIVTGLFTGYSGITNNRIVRLNTGGTKDTTFSIGTGFNAETQSIIVNGDDSMYVSGQFTTYNGSPSQGIVKLASGGTKDTSFAIGASGFNLITTVRMLPSETPGVYVYGDFTTYSGLSANKIIKLLPTSYRDDTFIYGTGFNNFVHAAYKVLGNKLLCSGTYTQYNGVNSDRNIVLNNDGSIFRTFPSGYRNVYEVDGIFYGNQSTGGTTHIIFDETLPYLSPVSIQANPSVRYYSVDVLKNEPWTVSKIDLGSGTSWVTLNTTAGTGSQEVVIKVDEKASQIAPLVYQPRSLNLRFEFSGETREVRVTQLPLQA